MFVFSFKMTKRIILMLCLAAFGIIGLIYAPFHPREMAASAPAAREEKISLKAGDSQQRADFLAQFGWETDPAPLEICEVVIPEQFDPVYEKYNALQKEQNFDLLKYKGRRVKRYTYSITNYPDYAGPVVANILVYKEKVIGGDVCSLSLDGFMRGFEKQG